MLTRDNLIGELNKAAEAIATARSTDDTEAIAAAVVRFDSIERELKALDRTAPQVSVIDETPEVKSFGRSAADKLTGAPIGSSVSLERTLLADPFGQAEGAQDAVLPQQLTQIVGKPDAPIRFIDTLVTAPATSDTVTYIRETDFTNAAAARLAGSTTSESFVNVEKVSEPIANVAHRIRAAEETLADNTALGALIDRRGAFGVRNVANAQLLANANTPNGMKSVVAAASDMDYSGTLTDAILSAKVELEHLGFTANYVLVTPAKFEEIVAEKAEDGHYIAGGPYGAGVATIWGLRLVTDSALPAGVDALVYDNSAATLYVRQAADVATDRDIVSNVVTVRVQTRGQVAVERPEGFIKLSAAGAGS
jgi:HK97 family phage major capsid protein